VPSEEEDTITATELFLSVETPKASKAAGCNKIRPEMLGVIWITRGFQLPWNSGRAPKNWQTLWSFPFPIHKKGTESNAATTEAFLSPLLFIVYMNWTDSRSRVDEGVTVGGCWSNGLLFADDLVLLASFEQGLQHTLDGFSAACDQSRMKISTKKTKVLCLFRSQR